MTTRPTSTFYTCIAGSRNLRPLCLIVQLCKYDSFGWLTVWLSSQSHCPPALFFLFFLLCHSFPRHIILGLTVDDDDRSRCTWEMDNPSLACEVLYIQYIARTPMHAVQVNCAVHKNSAGQQRGINLSHGYLFGQQHGIRQQQQLLLLRP